MQQRIKIFSQTQPAKLIIKSIQVVFAHPYHHTGVPEPVKGDQGRAGVGRNTTPASVSGINQDNSSHI
jgi:hypothetical protein